MLIYANITALTMMASAHTAILSCSPHYFMYFQAQGQQEYGGVAI